MPPPTDPDALVRDRLRKVLALFREIAAAQPADGRWPVRIAETYRALGQTHAAVHAYREAAQAYLNSGQDLDALSACTQALRLSPNDGPCLRLLESLVEQQRGAAARPAPTSLRPEPPAVRPREDEARASLDQFEFARVLPARHPTGAPAGTAEIDIGQADELDTGYEELSADELTSVEPDPPRPPPPPPRVALAPPAARASSTPSTPGAGVEVLFDDRGDEDADRLRRVSLLGELPYDAIALLVACVEPLTFGPGDRVIAEGDEADKVYVVARGDLVATRGDPPRPVARLSEGAFFGEMALLDDTPRSATVTAVTDAEVLALPRTIVLEVCERHPAVLARLLRSLRARLIATLTTTSPLFSGIPAAQRPPIVARFRLREVEPGTDLIRAGAPADALYVVLTGRADVLAAGTPVATLTTGDVAGELALLSHGPSEVTVRTRSWVTVLALPAAELDAITTLHPPVLAHLARVAETRRTELGASSPPPPAPAGSGVRTLRRV